MPAATTEDQGVPIASVEQTTGIARATLRIWERRYGFPQPGRDPRGERSYPDDQVQKLRLIANLIARGHRPGRLVGLSASQLASLAGAANAPGREGRAALVNDPVVNALRQHDLASVQQQLAESLRTLGLAAFVTDRMAGLNVDVGQAWARGELEVYEEHLYTEIVQQLVRAELAKLPPVAAGRHPRVLLATFPDESHGLGLLMAQALLALADCPCTSLGVRVPIPQIVTAVSAFRADVVGLSFTGSINPAHVMRGLEQLRGELSPAVEIWAGGSSPVLQRHRFPGVQPVPHIQELRGTVAGWRSERAS